MTGFPNEAQPANRLTRAARQFQDSAPFAITLLIAAMLCFDLMGVIARFLLARYSAPELSAYRNVIGIVPSIAMLLWTGELRLGTNALRIRRWPLAVLRGLAVALAQLLFYAALQHLELATISALAQTNALFVVLLSIVLLGDRVGVWRWGAVALGFFGAVLILKPGSDAFSIPAMLPIGAACCFAFIMVSVRMFGNEVSNGVLFFYASVTAGLFAVLIAAATTEFTAIQSWWDAGLIFVMANLGGVGVLLMMLAYRRAAPAVLAPFTYVGLLTAFFWGWLFFGEAPIDTLFPGVIFIVAAGVLIMWRENRR